ncbi:MAG: formyltransferase family protein [Pseudomonadota bacterium]
MRDSLKVDLFLEGPLGLWVLDYCEDEHIGGVYSHSDGLVKRARARSLAAATFKDELPEPIGDILVNVHATRIFPGDYLDRYKKAYNLHPGYLPWGKGTNSAFWAMWNDEPAGATLHEMDENIDTGPVVARTQIEYDSESILGELQQAIEAAERALFADYWEAIRTGTAAGANDLTLDVESGSTYTTSDYSSLIRQLRENWRDLSSEKLVKLLRCVHSFPFYLDSRLVTLSIQSQPRKR